MTTLKRRLGILAVVLLTTIPISLLVLLIDGSPPRPLFAFEADGKSSDGSIAFSPDGRWLAFCTRDGLSVCQITEGQKARTAVELPIACRSVAFTHDSRSLLAPWGLKGLLVIDPRNGQILDTIGFKGQWAETVVASPTDDSVAVIRAKTDYSEYSLETLRLGNPSSRQVLSNFTDNPRDWPVFSSDGKHLSHAVNGDRLQVWQTSDWAESHSIATKEKYPVASAFPPGGEKLVFGGFNQRCRFWSLKNDMELESWSASSRIDALAYHPSGDLVALCNYPPLWIGQRSARLTVWDSNGKRKGSFRPFAGFARALTISRDGRYLAIVGQDRRLETVKVWEWDSVVGIRSP
jgi:WD40 repeat protein